MRWIRISETDTINLEKVYKMSMRKWADGSCAILFYTENLIQIGSMAFSTEKEMLEKFKKFFEVN